MSKKVLYIDPFYQTGHCDFNNGYIKAFREAGAIIHFVVVEGYENYLDIENNEIVYRIPAFLERSDFGGLGNRICHLISLLLIRSKINFSNYDVVFFSNFEEISFYFSRIKKCILTPHINISESCNKIKFFFLNKVLQGNSCIAFNKNISNYLHNKGDYHIIEQALGLPAPIRVKQKENYLKKEQKIIEKLGGYKKILFSPSAQSSDNDFIQDLIDDVSFLSMLEKSEMVFVAKGNYKSKHSNVLVVNYYLSLALYQYLFMKSDCILLAYPKSFRYRVSAILFECFANNKACLVPSTEAFTVYKDFFTYTACYTDKIDLIKKLEQFEVSENTDYCNTEQLQPNFKSLINEK